MLIAAIIFAVLAITSSWLTVLLVTACPWWVGAVATGVSLLLIGTILLVRRISAIAKASALERELLRQASQHADRARPDRRGEVLALQANMKQAIEALKRSKLAKKKGSKTALYALPWYVVVGPPAAGKTTALEQSGLAFTSPVANAPKIKGTAGTRNCDWWFSQEAILLDTAGRFATDDDDKDEWEAFLDTIKRFRPERPLDGVVVALSISDLAGASEAQIEELADKLRTRVDEIMARLEMVVPIYVMFTKADLIGGFIEFFGDLTKQQRGQPWGATFAIDDERLADAARACEAEFDLLVRALHARMIDRLSRERMPEVRARVLQFPLEVQSLRAPIALFMDLLCRQNPYQETPILRGFYFSSGTQVGRPLDRVMSNMARGFDLGQLPGPAAQPAGQPVSYFVTDLFRQIIFPDRHVAVRTTGSLQRYARRQIFIGAAALFATMMLVLPATISYLNDLDLVHDTKEDLEKVATLEKSKGSATEALGTLAKRIETLEQARAGFRIPGIVGTAAASRLYEPVREIYASRVRDIVDGPVKKLVREEVRAIGDSSRTDVDSFLAAYDTLKLYLMMSDPSHMDAEWATSRLAAKWARAVRTDGAIDSEKLVPHARFYIDALLADKALVWSADDALVGRARTRLRSLPYQELQYGMLLGKAEGVAAIAADTIFRGPALQFVTGKGVQLHDVQVLGVYTAAGWEKIKAALDPDSAKRLVLDSWVMGGVMLGGDEETKAVTERLRDLYFQRYEKAWSSFLDGIAVESPREIRTAIEELMAISENDGPYNRLFQVFSENLRLDMEPPTLVGKAAEKAGDFLQGVVKSATDKVTGKDSGAPADRKVSPVERHFKTLLRFGFGEAGAPKAEGSGTSLTQYIVQVSNLAGALRTLQETKPDVMTEFQGELARATAGVERLLLPLDPSTRLLLEPILMNPIRATRAVATQAGNSALDDKWKNEVWQTWSDKIADRYPFSDGSTKEVSLAEFSDFFRPQAGAFWKFYDANLASRLERHGSQFAPKASSDPETLRGDFLQCLNHAQEITEALFGTSPEPLVTFALQMHSAGAEVAEIDFTVDGAMRAYKNEPEQWTGGQWPGKGAPKGASIQAKGAGFQEQAARAGDFGFFRLLWAGSLKPTATDSVFAAVFPLTRAGQEPLHIEIRASKRAHPFARDFFSRLKCPEHIVAAAPAEGPPGGLDAPRGGRSKRGYVTP